MYCDYNALKEYANFLNKTFNSFNDTISNLEDTLENILSVNNWDTKTRDYVLKEYKTLENNFLIITNKFNNINLYIDKVINNYKALDEQTNLF